MATICILLVNLPSTSIIHQKIPGPFAKLQLSQQLRHQQGATDHPNTPREGHQTLRHTRLLSHIEGGCARDANLGPGDPNLQTLGPLLSFRKKLVNGRFLDVLIETLGFLTCTKNTNNTWDLMNRKTRDLENR